ncbi:hypothetical protein D3C81_2055190 [compost metagenome]
MPGLATDLTQDHLTTIGLVPAVQIVAAGAPLHRPKDRLAGAPRVNAADHHVADEAIIAANLSGLRFPACPHQIV